MVTKGAMGQFEDCQIVLDFVCVLSCMGIINGH